MENEIKESLRYYNAFVKELQDYKDLSTIEFYQEYIDTKLENEISNEWDFLDSETKDNYKDYEEYKEQYIEDNINEDDIEESIRKYFDPLDITTYECVYDDYRIYEIQLTWWWPRIDIRIETRRNRSIYSFNWWWDNLEKDISNYTDLLLQIYWLDY